MDEIIDVTDGARVQPRGYHPHRITEPPTDVAWQDVRTYVPEDPADLPCVLPTRTVQSMVNALGGMRLMTDLITEQGQPAVNGELAAKVSAGLGQVQRVLRKFAGGAAVLAVALVALVTVPGAPAAQAAEGPQPDPAVSATYRVTLGARPVQVLVRATVDARTPGGYFCGSVWAAGFLSRACSLTPTFTIPVSIYPGQWPVGRTLAQVVDDASDTAVATIVLDARRPSMFGVGTYIDAGRGQLSVKVPVTLYSPTLGRWVGQSQSPVQIQEFTRRGWRTKATLWTNPPGLATGLVALGGGVHVIRAVRPDGSSVWGTTGQARVVTVTTEPLDIN